MDTLPLLDEFIAHLRLERTLSENTVDSYRFDLSRLGSFLNQQGLTSLRLVNAGHLSAYIRALHDVGFASTSIARTLSSLRGYFAFAVAEGAAALDPTILLESPRSGRYLPSVLTIEEIEKILAVIDTGTRCGTRDRAMLETLYATGMRVSELAAFQRRASACRRRAGADIRQGIEGADRADRGGRA